MFRRLLSVSFTSLRQCPTRSHSNIDYYLVSSDRIPMIYLSNAVSHCTLENPDNLSSHDPVFASLNVLLKPQPRREPRQYENWTNLTVVVDYLDGHIPESHCFKIPLYYLKAFLPFSCVCQFSLLIFLLHQFLHSGLQSLPCAAKNA